VKAEELKSHGQLARAYAAQEQLVLLSLGAAMQLLQV
jgi:hypothetical protein